MFRTLIAAGLATLVGCIEPITIEQARANFRSGNYTHLTAGKETEHRGKDLYILQEEIEASIAETWRRKRNSQYGAIGHTNVEAKNMLALYNVITEIDPQTTKRFNKQLFMDSLLIKLRVGEVIKIGERELIKIDSEPLPDNGYRIKLEKRDGQTLSLITVGQDFCGPFFGQCIM